jgi:hypothetical protein
MYPEHTRSPRLAVGRRGDHHPDGGLTDATLGHSDAAARWRANPRTYAEERKQPRAFRGRHERQERTTKIRRHVGHGIPHGRVTSRRQYGRPENGNRCGSLHAGSLTPGTKEPTGTERPSAVSLSWGAPGAATTTPPEQTAHRPRPGSRRVRERGVGVPDTDHLMVGCRPLADEREVSAGGQE